MMLNVVLDTNIIISAAISKNGNPAKVMNMALEKSVQAYYSTEIMNEYKEVLSRPEFNFDSEKQKSFILGMKTAGIQIEPVASDVSMTDEDDRIFYDVAYTTGAILISGNTRHYPPDSFVMTPTDFLIMYNAENGQIG